jgi:hypothetical protein
LVWNPVLKKGGLLADKFGQCFLEFDVDIQGAVQKTRPGTAVPFS